MNIYELLIIIVICVLTIGSIIVFRYILKQKHDISELNRRYADNTTVIEELKDYNKLLESIRDETVNLSDTNVDNYSVVSYTGISLLDSLFSYKKNQADEQGIVVTIRCDNGFLWNMKESDTVELFNNMFDNAIESAGKVDDSYIELDIINNYGLRIVMTNSKSYETRIDKVAEGFHTTKADEKAHGFGISVITHITEKYGGKAAFTDEGNVFRVEIDFDSRRSISR